MIRWIFAIVGVLVATVLLVMGNFWLHNYPSSPVTALPVKTVSVIELPKRNQEVIAFIEKNGATIAPNYLDVVCTEFVIKVIEAFTPLTKAEKKSVRIITTQPLDELVENEDAVIKGVYTALLTGSKGIPVNDFKDVKPGDFVQFWNSIYGSSAGHCGIVKDIVPDESLTLYSSHPATNGYGVHTFLWPQKLYFVRLK